MGNNQDQGNKGNQQGGSSQGAAVKAAAISPHRINRGNRAKVATNPEARAVNSPASRNEAVSRAARATQGGQSRQGSRDDEESGGSSKSRGGPVDKAQDPAAKATGIDKA